MVQGALGLSCPHGPCIKFLTTVACAWGWVIGSGSTALMAGFRLYHQEGSNLKPPAIGIRCHCKKIIRWLGDCHSLNQCAHYDIALP